MTKHTITISKTKHTTLMAIPALSSLSDFSSVVVLIVLAIVVLFDIFISAQSKRLTKMSPIQY